MTTYNFDRIRRLRQFVKGEMVSEMRPKNPVADETFLNPVWVEARLQTYMQAGLVAPDEPRSAAQAAKDAMRGKA